MRISKSVMTVGGVVLAAGMIGFTNPKTVHAVTAALVQVTNTASNPVVTQGTEHQAAQVVHLLCNSAHSQNCILDSPSSIVPGSDPYVVPANESLVVTTVDIVPAEIFVPGCNLNHIVNLTPSAGGYAQEWIVNNSSMHFDYLSGIVFPPGSSVQATNTQYFGLTPATAVCDSGPDQVDVRGYLTAN